MSSTTEQTEYKDFRVSTIYTTSNGHCVQLKKSVGKGAFGMVFKASCEERTIAVKVIKLLDSRHKKEIETEISFLERFSSSGFTPRLFGYTKFSDCIAVEMQLLGHSLFKMKKLLPMGPAFPADDVLDITMQLLKAVAKIHSVGLVHCDVKPQNICYARGGSGRIMIIDFGQCQKTTTLSRLSPGEALVTLHYESPEALFGLPLTNKLDIWSVGISLGELMTGKLVFDPRSRGHLVRDLAAANLVPSAAIGNQFYQKLSVVPPEGFPTPAPFTNLKEHLIQNTTGVGWTKDNKTKFIDFVCRLVTPDTAFRPSAEEALQLFKEGQFDV